MVFSSLLFIYAFFPISVLLYFAAPNIKTKNTVLTCLSLFFYAWGEPVWVCLLIFSALVDYINGLIISRHYGKWQAKAALIASLVINLSLLGFFKYLNFFAETLGLLIGRQFSFVGFELPIGISFYTFQTLSYTIDVYKGQVGAQKSFRDFLLFVSLFPQLIAGPILRYSELEKQLSERKSTWEKTSEGISRFVCGLGKKVLLANVAGKLGDSLLGGDLTALAAADAWFGLLAFTFQIYFDFSGYSDMAIGLGKIFGFQYSENFRYPYASASITSFWRRWHISLGSFFRDYVYIPLGGNRRRQMLNLFVVWFLTGLWHGASWNFVFWGLYYFVLLVLEKYIFKKFLSAKRVKPLAWLYCFFFVVLGWSLFYFTDMQRLASFLTAAFGFGSLGMFGPRSFYLWVGNLPLLIFCALACTPLPVMLARRIPERVRFSADIAYNMGLLVLCTISLVGQSYNPFLYFRF